MVIKHKNIIMVDMPVNENWGLKKGIEETSRCTWEIRYREGRLSIPRYKRIYNFIEYPLYILFFVKSAKIIAWQQFYGLLYCFYNKLLRINQSVNVTILTFIYKERKGFVGKLYKWFISYCLSCKNLKNVIVFSENEIDYYSKCFPKYSDKFKFYPLGIASIPKDRYKIDCELYAQKYIFTSGASNRDYEFMISALNGTKYNVKIACQGLNLPHEKNIEILNNVHGTKMLSYLYNCKIVVIPLKDLNISSGQLMILQAMQLGKPIIVTNNKSVYSYIKDYYNGFIISNDKNELLKKVNILFNDKNIYDKMSQNEIQTFQQKFSIKALGKQIGFIV